MTAGRLIVPGFQPAENANTDRLGGAKLYWYANLTTDLAPVYTTAALNVLISNPVAADADGNFPPMWADTTSTFSVVGTDTAGVPQPGVAYDGISPTIDATLASVALAEAAQQAAQDAASNAMAADTTANQSAAEAAASAVTAAAAAATAVEIAGFDPTGYQLKTEKGAALGYAGLDAAGLVPSVHLTGAPISTLQQAAMDAKMNVSDGATKAFAIAAAVAL